MLIGNYKIQEGETERIEYFGHAYESLVHYQILMDASLYCTEFVDHRYFSNILNEGETTEAD